MKFNKISALVLLFILENIFIIAIYSDARNTFNSRMDEDINVVEQHLRRDGESPEKIRHLVTALQSVKSNVATYVWQTYWITSTITILSFFFPLLVIKHFLNNSKEQKRE